MNIKSPFTHNYPNERFVKMMVHNCVISDAIRDENEAYNQHFIKETRLVGSERVPADTLSPLSGGDGTGFMVVWLKNIDRLLNMISREIDFSDYSLIDVGCGTGISTIYFAGKANFKSVIGFDYSTELIKVAKKNYATASMTNSDLKCEFFMADANTHELNDEPSILFLFNPFGENTLRTFLNNNYKNIKGSILLYANDLHINTLLEYGELLDRDATFNLSVVKFN